MKKCQYLILFYLPTRFLINLVAANLLITFVLVPLILIDLIWPSIDSEYLPFYCYILRGMTTLTSSASILGKNPINYGCIFYSIYYMVLRFQVGIIEELRPEKTYDIAILQEFQ